MKHKTGLSLDAQNLNRKPCLFTLNKGVAHFNFTIMQFWDSDVNEDGHGADWPPVNSKGFLLRSSYDCTMWHPHVIFAASKPQSSFHSYRVPNKKQQLNVRTFRTTPT